MRKIIILIACLLCDTAIRAQITIEECVDKAMANYPAIVRYQLLDITESIDLADITTSWYPRITLYAQATGQNAVPSFPSALSNMVAQMGQNIEGLSKFQYQGGVEVSQSIWDGGASRKRKDMTRAQTALRKAALDVEMYAIRERVENIYFAILLTETQIERNRITHNLMLNNLQKLQAMLRKGTAMQADCDMLEARALTVAQSIARAQYAVKGYRQVLGLYTGEDMESATLMQPDMPAIPAGESMRPELNLFSAQTDANNMADQLWRTGLRPKIGAFVQAYYGYPGMNYFKSMVDRNPSLNLLAGVKFTWNFDSFYTRTNNNRRTGIMNREINADRDTFLFNTNLQRSSQMQAIEAMQAVMKEDDRIVELQANVRRAAESQLANGVIDITALLTKIADETAAALNAKCHEIQLLQEIYKLKYVLNR
ncbi:MAG: TolC family protein [Paramuribaculum sp.]|nr:TolC family protein [Paramuribaculum sp.]